MGNFRDYDEAKALYYSKLNIIKQPIYSLEFHYDYLKVLKNNFLDMNAIQLISKKNNWVENDWDIKSILNEEVIVVTDIHLNIVFASHNVQKMNGYTPNEIIGKSPKMFQGLETNPNTSNEIRLSILEKKAFEKNVINYKKNGELYNCLIKGFPVFNLNGDLIHYIAFEKAA